ncbi:MAG: NAD(P)/FAD-dependent oxidoreductase [Pyrinomonadaceae bacterium]
MSKPRILIVGGGFGGLFTALELAGHCDVTLISDSDHFVFTPMLYEYFSGEVEEWHIAPRFEELLNESVRFIRGTVIGIDLSSQSVEIAPYKGTTEYDVLILAVGGITNYAGINGAEEFSLPFRKIEHADALRRQMIKTLDRIPPDRPPQDVQHSATFALVGAGASGVELSTKMADLLQDAFKRRSLKGEPRVLLIEMSDKVVPGMGEQIRNYVEAALRDSRVEIHTLTRVTALSSDSITFEHDGDSKQVKTAGVVWAGGVRMRPLIEKLPVEKTKHGLLQIRPTLQLASHDNVFALGDIALYPDTAPTLGGTAQLAFQEASLTGANVKRLLAGKQLQTKHFEELGEAVSLGTDKAAILVEGKAFGGPLARQARFALYTSRLPTWHHRLKVGASWFFGGTAPRPLLPLGFERSSR